MKKTSKIIIILIVLSIVGTIVFPMISMLQVNMGSIFDFLSKVASSAIVKASDDWEYAGNLIFKLTDDNDMIVGGSGTEFNGTVEVSVNGAEYKQIRWERTSIPLDNNVNEVIIRTTNHEEVARAVIVKADNRLIIMQNSKVHYQNGDTIYAREKDQYIYEYSSDDYEYSLDGGQTYYHLEIFNTDKDLYANQDWEPRNIAVKGGTLYTDKIIIRKKDTEEIIYQTPEGNIEIDEDYEYENGKTTVKLKNSGEDIENIKYSYETDGQKTESDQFTVEEDTNVILNAETSVEFKKKTAEKEINVKVIKVENPEIKIDDESNLELIAGKIENDILGKMYYKIDNEKEIEYTEKTKLNLKSGNHTIKAYQESKDENVKSKEVEEEVIVEEPAVEKQEEINKQGNITAEENKETNKDNQKQTKKIIKSNAPKTGDKILIFAIIFFAIIILNIAIIVIRKKKNK